MRYITATISQLIITYTCIASVTMQFKFPKSYPHVFPIFEIVDCEDLDRPAEIDILEMIENLVT